jgi:hypothetical protein
LDYLNISTVFASMDDLAEIQALLRAEEKCNHVSFCGKNLVFLLFAIVF